MNFADRYFAQKLETWAKARLAERTAQIASGLAADYADYRNRVGYLEALNDMLNEMQVTEREMSPQRQESSV